MNMNIPWETNACPVISDSKGQVVALISMECHEWQGEDLAVAEFIVRAVNNHDALVAALDLVLNPPPPGLMEHSAVLETARMALAIAKKEKQP